jgi:cell division protease FtsH
MALGTEAPNSFLRQVGGSDARNFSEQTARLVDEEIRQLVTRALDRARSVLREHREKVEAIAARLLATEAIEEEEITRLIGPKVTAPQHLLNGHDHGNALNEPAAEQGEDALAQAPHA